MHDRILSAAEAPSVAVAGSLSAIVASGYVWGRVGGISPFGLLAIALAVAIVLGRYAFRRAETDNAALFAAAIVFVGVAAWLCSLTWPGLLLPGGGPDLSHHLMLVDFVERHWRLPDTSHVGAMVEMSQYTPGLHLLAALAGAWFATDGFHAIYATLVVSVALKCVFVFLIARRVLPSSRGRVPMAVIAVILCILPTEYFLGSFVHESFLAQVAAEMFAVAMLWAIVVWDHRPSALAASLFGVFGTGAFLTWPIWIGPPIVTLVAVVLTHEAQHLRDRLRHLAIALLPIAAAAAAHTAGRVGWLAIAGTTGIVLRPSIEHLGWTFLVTAPAGVVIAAFRRESRAPLLLALSVAVQSATLYGLAQARGAAVPYMAFKMAYLAIYPLGVLGAAAVAYLTGVRRPGPQRTALAGPATLLVAIVALAVALREFPAPTPVVSSDLYQAGRWARAHVDAACVDYLVPGHETMHWLHLAVLGNPRSSPRSADPGTFDPEKALIRWIEPAGLPYAVAQLSTLPRDVLGNVDVLEQFGSAAVVSRRGPTTCADARRLAGDVSRKP